MKRVTDFPGVYPDRLDLDSTKGFQAALNSRQTVSVPHALFLIDGNLIGDHASALQGECVWSDPMVPPWDLCQGPTLLTRARGGDAFIHLPGSSGGLENLIIAHPEQYRPNEAPGPKVYPPTILSTGSNMIESCYLPNSYIGIKLLCGRSHVQNCQIGAFKQDIVIDNSLDVNRIENVVMSVYWDWLIGGMKPQTSLDWWAMNNGVGLTVGKADGLQLSNVLVFGRNIGILFEKSTYFENGVLKHPDGAVSGHAKLVNLDTVRHGVIAKASEERVGFEFQSLILGPLRDREQPGYTPGHAIWLQRSGVGTSTTSPPRISVLGGSIRHLWAKKADGSDWAFRNDWGAGNVGEGKLWIRDMIGQSLQERL